MNETTPNLTCTFHPQRETRLRCNRCNRPICIKCAQHTPTGYRCPDCIKTQQKVFVTAKWGDYLIGIFIAGLFSFLGSLLAASLGFFTLLIAPIVGGVTVTVIRKAIQNRRAPLLYKVITATALISSLPVIVLRLIRFLPVLMNYGLGATVGLFSLVWVVVYAAVVTSTIYYQLH